MKENNPLSAIAESFILQYQNAGALWLTSVPAICPKDILLAWKIHHQTSHYKNFDDGWNLRREDEMKLSFGSNAVAMEEIAVRFQVYLEQLI